MTVFLRARRGAVCAGDGSRSGGAPRYPSTTLVGPPRDTPRGARRRRAVREPKEALLPASVTARECPSYHAEVAARSPRRSQADEPEAPGARSAGPRPRRQPPRSRPNAAPRPARGSGRETRGRQAAHPRKGLPRGGAPACLCFLSASNHLIDFNSFMICMAI